MEVSSKSASNVKQLICWNCGEVGHQKINCSKPEKGTEDKKSGKKKSRGKDSDQDRLKAKKSNHESGYGKHQKGKKKSYQGSARKADNNSSDDSSNESESGLDKTVNWIGLIQYGNKLLLGDGLLTNNGELPDAKDWTINAGDIAGKALRHVIQEAEISDRLSLGDGLPMNNGELPNTKDQVVNAGDIAKKALWHIAWEVETFDAKVKADNAQDNAGEALRHNVEKALTRNSAREALWHNTKKALEYNNSPDAKNRAGMARNSTGKALNINEPYTKLISEVMLYKCAREAESGDD